MKEIDILRDLFDEKILKIITILLENPESKLSLSEISESSKVNITTTFRIINKLVEKKFIDVIIVGKTKFYKIERNEKGLVLLNFLKKDENQLLEFINLIKKVPEIEKVILESKTKNEAKTILVSNNLPSKKIKSIIDKIKKQYRYIINYIPINEKQFNEMEKMGLYELNKKIIWERPKN